LGLDVEFMHSKRFYSVQLIADFYQRLADKLNNLPPYDLIMTADDNATRAAVERRAELFGNTPLVFLGVNDRSFALSQDLSPQVTGIVEATSMLETAQLASRLSPQHPLVVVADATPSGQSDLAGFRRQIEAKFTLPPRVLSLVDLSFSDLEAALRLLAPDSSLLLLSAYRDKNGVTLTFNDSLEKVLAAYPGRVFHMWEHGIGQGVVGGVVISHFEQGRAAAALGARIFKGEPLSALAVVRDSPNLPLFDHEALQQHGIARSSLPIDSRIINQPRGGIELSTEELAWLRDHKKIRVGGETDWAPYAFVDDSGRFAGIAQDYLKIITEKLGIELEIVTGPTWGELLRMARDKQIDALPAIYHSEEKKAYLHFTRPYARVTEFIFTRNQTTDVSDMADLKGRSVAVVAGYATQNLLHTRYPEVEVVTTPSIREALKKVVTGEADAFIGDIASTQYNIQRYALSGIRAISAAPSREETVRMAVRQDWSELRNLIDKVLEVMTPVEHNAIRARWLNNLRFPHAKLSLTPEEQSWIAEHPVIRVVVDPDFLPYEALDENGRYSGIGADYNQMIAERLGIRFEVVPTMTWSKSLEMVRKREADLLPILTDTPERRKFLNFAKPHASTPSVLITRIGENRFRKLEDMSGKSIALVREYADSTRIPALFPDIRVVTVESGEEALKAVATNRADATVAYLPVAEYVIQNQSLANLQVAGPVEELGMGKLGYGVRSDWPKLIPILNKALASIGPDEHLAIMSKWGRQIMARQSSPAYDLRLSKEERGWLAQHQVITMGVDPDFAPYEWIDENGNYVGIAADYLNLISKRLGIRFEVKQNLSWEQASAMGRAKQLDIHPMLTPTDERKKSYLFTRTYVRDPYVIIQNKNQQSVTNQAQLAGKRVALVRGYSATELTLKNQPDVVPVYVDSETESLLAVASGMADATVGHLGSLVDKIRQNHLANLNIAAYTNFKTKGMGIAVRNDWPILRDLLDHALASISPGERREINQYWIKLDEAEPIEQLDLSPEESNWLSNHPVVRVLMDPSWAPVEFTDAEGRNQGISVDYLKRIEDLLGIELEIATGLSWKDGVQAMRDKRLDMASAVARTREREGFAVFTEPYISMPVNIFARNDVLYIGRLENLAGKRVAVVEDYAVTEWLTQDHPEIVQVPVTAPGEALQMVADGSVIAFVGNVVTASYYIGKLSLHSVRVAGETPYSYDQAMAVRDDWPIFAGILQKALDAIDQPQRDAIYNRWMSIRYEVEADYSLLWQVLAVVAVVLALFLYWNRRLAREITARQQTELALSHAKEAAEAARESAESANRAKSIFLANMSHELRTPLNAILGFSEIMEKHVEASQDQKEKLGIISRSGKHLLNMINDVLDLSKIEAGRVEIDNEIFNLKKQIEETAQIFSEKVRSTGLEFKLFFDSRLPDFIEADRNKLNQILINLLGNADKFTMHGGYSLHVESNPIADDPQREQLLLTVSDTGPGIDPELQQRIFEPFTQEGRTASTTIGTGLGLSICKSYAELMGGHISNESKPGKGSQFRVELPIMPVQRPQDSDKEMVFDSVQGLAPGQDDIRVMVVEDNGENRLL
ncbi:MAG: transporter substrate-binding domain-containing protein, partial [Candidatus Thiodiazotropha endolucinida]